MLHALAFFEGANRLGENPLVGVRPERVFGNDIKGDAAADDHLLEKKADGARHVKAGTVEKVLGPTLNVFLVCATMWSQF